MAFRKISDVNNWVTQMNFVILKIVIIGHFLHHILCEFRRYNHVRLKVCMYVCVCTSWFYTNFGLHKSFNRRKFLFAISHSRNTASLKVFRLIIESACFCHI